MKLGSECDHCALRDAPLVGGSIERSSQVLFVGEAPGIDEVKQGAPFVGRSGHELQDALRHPLSRYSRTNAVLCRPPENDLAKVRRRAKKLQLLDPVRCCNARLQREVAQHPFVILLGPTAVEACLHGKAEIMGLRGFPIRRPSVGGSRERIYFPTVHPTHVVRNPRWRHVFRSDIDKAFRTFRNALVWKPPTIVSNGLGKKGNTLTAAVHRLCRDAERTRRVYLDVETYGDTALEPLVADLGLLGLATDEEWVVVVPFYSKATHQKLRPPKEALQKIRQLFKNPRIAKIGHNAGSYDRMVLERYFGPIAPWEDTLLKHHVVEPELPHSLQYVASMYTDIHAWKQVRGGLEVESDAEWKKYNAYDVAVTVACDGRLSPMVALRNQESVLEIDHKLQRFAVDLHRVGLHLDRAAQGNHAHALQAAQVKAGRALKEIAGRDDFNPGSTAQLSELLFDTLKLPYDPEWETEGGNRGTSMEVIRGLLVHPSVLPEQQRVLTLVHQYRRAQKFYGTYVRDLVPLADGRVHFDFNPAGTISGRFSGAALTIPRSLRNMFSAAPGHVLVGADMDQLELRMITALAGLRKYLDVFHAGGDPHALTMDLLYGEAWRANTDKAEVQKLRDFAKRFSFGNAYGAGVTTVWGVMRATEGTDGGFPYLTMAEAFVAAKREAWLAAIPELPIWWRSQVAKWRDHTYLKSPILGRRRDFLDGEDRNEIVNYEVQSGGRDVVIGAILELRDEHGITTGFDGPGTGIVHDGHDSLVVECQESSVDKVKKALHTAMNREAVGLKFTSKAKVGRNWSEV